MTSEKRVIDDEAEVATIQIAQSCAVPFALRAAILLGVPDILKGAGPAAKLTTEEIASRITSPDGTLVDRDNLDRLLRLLASNNLVTEHVSANPEDPSTLLRRYGTTPVMKCLTSSNDGVSLARLLLVHTEPVFISTLHYLHAPILDRNADLHVLAHGKRCFELLGADRALDTLFNKGMGDATTVLNALLLQRYQGFEGLSSLVDAGGGVGTNLALILPKYPSLRGINFDLPHVMVNGIKAPRLEHVGGDFFESVPQGDAVWMKWVLHGWTDEDCLKILRNIFKALPPHGKLINMDAMLPELSESSVKARASFSTDVHMMAFCEGGKERTVSQLRKLGLEAGFVRVELAATFANQAVVEFYKS